MSTTKSATQPKSRYPPEIEAIIKSTSKRPINNPDSNADDLSTDDGREWGFGPIHQQDLSPPSVNNDAVPSQTPDHFLSTEVAAPLRESSELVREPYLPREKAIHTIKTAIQNLGQMRDGMHDTIHEYFSSTIMINWLEVPAFRSCRKAITRLISALDALATSLESRVYYNDETDIDFMMYQISLVLDNVLAHGEPLLQAWNRRDFGQTVGQPLTGQNFRIRQISIHTSNEQIELLKSLVRAAKVKVQQEQASRQPLMEAKIKRGRGLGWLKYMSVTGNGLGVFRRASDSERHREDDRFGWRLRVQYFGI